MLNDPKVRLHEVEITIMSPFKPMLGDRGQPNKVNIHVRGPWNKVNIHVRGHGQPNKVNIHVRGPRTAEQGKYTC